MEYKKGDRIEITRYGSKVNGIIYNDVAGGDICIMFNCDDKLSLDKDTYIFGWWFSENRLDDSENNSGVSSLKHIKLSTVEYNETCFLFDKK